MLHILWHKLDLTWICLGAFNEIVSNAKKNDGTIKPQWLINNYRYVVDFFDVLDMGFICSAFTQMKVCINGADAQERLNHAWKFLLGVLMNGGLFFLNVTVHHLNSHKFDNSYIFVVAHGLGVLWRRKIIFPLQVDG